MFNSILEIMTQLNSVNCMKHEDNYQFLKKKKIAISSAVLSRGRARNR